jgi:hypothetical protein
MSVSEAREIRRPVSDVTEFLRSEIVAQPRIPTLDRESYWREVMLNATDLSKLDLSTIEVRTLTPEEWDAVKREAARRAHIERAKLMRGLVKGFRSWWQDHKRRRDSVVPAGKKSWS